MIPVIYNLRNLRVRKTTTILSALGIALVVAVLSSVLMLVEGIKRTLGQSSQSDTVIVLRKGSDAELASSLEEPQVSLVLAGPGIKRDNNGAPIGSGEVVVVIALDKVGTDGLSNVQVRGVADNVLALRPGVRITDGRMLRPGTNEVVIGQRLRGRFRGLDIGQSFELRKNRSVQVVGVFSDNGSSFESEVWSDRDSLRSAFGREGLVSSVRVRLASSVSYDAFEAYIERDKQLGLDAQRENEYYERQSEGLALFITVIGVLFAVLCSVGAIIGAVITMYASIADRQREIGTLRAIGFSRLAILSAFLIESLLLALGGGALGALASLGMGLVRFSIVNPQSWSEIVFSFTPTPLIILISMTAAAIMGLGGGFYPARRAAGISPVEAMRA